MSNVQFEGYLRQVCVNSKLQGFPEKITASSRVSKRMEWANFLKHTGEKDTQSQSGFYLVTVIKLNLTFQEQDLVRRGQSFTALKTNDKEDQPNLNFNQIKSDRDSTSTSRTVSISQVRVEVSRKLILR